MALFDAAWASRFLALRFSYSDADAIGSSLGISPVSGSRKNFSFIVMHLTQSPVRL